MSPNFDPPSPIRPLSAGNVVSTALVLYRSHLKTYLQLALTAYLWFLVPIYGWAKFWAISGLIARLAFAELINQPETVSAARSKINPRLWSFFRVAFQVGISLFGVYLGLLFLTYFVLVIVGVLFFAISQGSFNNQSWSILLGILAIFIAVAAIFGFIFGLIWFVSRWIIAEVPLAVEEDINGKQSVDRSWELTKTSVRRIQDVVMIAFLVTLPIIMVTNYIPQIFLVGIEPGSNLYRIVYLVSLIVSFAGGILVLPFWQTVKAVLYYDLRSRREGMGLQLHQPPLDDFS